MNSIGFKSFLGGRGNMPKQKLMAPGKRDTDNSSGHHQTHWSVPSLTFRHLGPLHSSLCTGCIWEPGTAEVPARLPLPHASQLTGLPSSWFFNSYVNKQNSCFWICHRFHIGFSTWWLRSYCIEKTSITHPPDPGVAKTVNQQQRSFPCTLCKSESLLQA